MHDRIHEMLMDSAEAMSVAAGSHSMIVAVTRAAEAVVASLRAGGKVLTFGNGGSAAQAAHLAGELVGRFRRERHAYAAACINVDPAVMTAVANDYGYHEVFDRQVDALGDRWDTLIGFSTSGRSANIVSGLMCGEVSARVLFCGAAGAVVNPHEVITVQAPSDVTSEIQETHLACIHALCEAVEGEVSGE